MTTAPKITQFDKPTVKALAAQIIEDLVELGKERGLNIDRGNAQFDNNTCTLQLKIAVINEDGVVASRWANEFPVFCKIPQAVVVAALHPELDTEGSFGVTKE